MQISSTQLFLLLAWLFCNNAAVVNRKRSPLEIGYVHFPQIKLKAKQTNSSFVETKPLVNILHPKNVWVPGHVRHHAYIPGHHVIVPAETVLVSRTVHTFLVRPQHADSRIELYAENPFRDVYGGFGVGVGVGGHGAGHGFQVFF